MEQGSKHRSGWHTRQGHCSKRWYIYTGPMSKFRRDDDEWVSFKTQEEANEFILNHAPEVSE